MHEVVQSWPTFLFGYANKRNLEHTMLLPPIEIHAAGICVC
jgi:hypothetical protein